MNLIAFKISPTLKYLGTFIMIEQGFEIYAFDRPALAGGGEVVLCPVDV